MTTDMKIRHNGTGSLVLEVKELRVVFSYGEPVAYWSESMYPKALYFNALVKQHSKTMRHIALAMLDVDMNELPSHKFYGNLFMHMKAHITALEISNERSVDGSGS